MTPEERRKLDEVHSFVQSMKSGATIPFDVGEAFRDRLVDDKVVLDTTGKSLTSEQHGAGAAGLKNPEFWEEVIAGNGIRYFRPLYS